MSTYNKNSGSQLRIVDWQPHSRHSTINTLLTTMVKHIILIHTRNSNYKLYNLNKVHIGTELVHKSLYDMHATRASHSVHSQGANSVQIVSSFNLPFSSADRVEFPNCEYCSVKIFFTVLKVLSGAAFELGTVSSAFTSAPRRANSKMHGS